MPFGSSVIAYFPCQLCCEMQTAKRWLFGFVISQRAVVALAANLWAGIRDELADRHGENHQRAAEGQRTCTQKKRVEPVRPRKKKFHLNSLENSISKAVEAALISRQSIDLDLLRQENFFIFLELRRIAGASRVWVAVEPGYFSWPGVTLCTTGSDDHQASVVCCVVVAADARAAD
jgi:hypothetical protein